MLHRLVWILLATLVLATSAGGCCCLDRYYYGDCQFRGLSGAFSGRCSDARVSCNSGSCKSGACGHGGCTEGGCDDGSCGVPACGGCGDCRSCCPRPFRAFWRMMTCSSGCGEFYWDEWFSDPPDPCDPCDDHGSFSGRGCCPPRWWMGVRGLNGYRCASRCDTSCGLTCAGGCGEAGCGCGSGDADHPEAPHHEPLPSPEVQPTPMPVESATRPYYAPPSTRQATYHAPHARSYSAATRSANYTTPQMAGEPVGTGVIRR